MSSACWSSVSLPFSTTQTARSSNLTRSIFITCLTQHLNDLENAVIANGIAVEDVIPSPIAASMVTLTKVQRMAGCVLANIGSETTSIAVFEEGIPLSVRVFPIGSRDITN